MPVKRAQVDQGCVNSFANIRIGSDFYRGQGLSDTSIQPFDFRGKIMDRGYFALWRKFQDHVFWKERREFSKAEAWIDILWNAQWKDEPQKVVFGMTILTQYYGECLKSNVTWGKRWGWSEPKVRRFTKLLENLGQISKKNEGLTTRITVLNYEQYDPRRRQCDDWATSKRRASDEQVTTNKKDNKDKKDNKILNRAKSWPSDFELDDNKKRYAIENGIAPGKVVAFWEDFRDWAAAKGAVYKDWDAAFRTRVRKAQEWGKQFIVSDGSYSVNKAADKKLAEYKRTMAL